MCSKLLRVAFALYLILQAWTAPIPVLQNDRPPLTAVISSHISSLNDRLESKQDPRLPLPSPQDIDTIRRIAEVLVMIGQQVIPAIVGSNTNGGTTSTATEILEDPVHSN